MLALIIDKYLSDKRHLQTENDSICIENEQIVKWDFANIPCPSQEELDALASVVEAEQSQQTINTQAQAFLDATDWMVVRAMERGEELSPEFKAERQAARDRIVK